MDRTARRISGRSLALPARSLAVARRRPSTSLEGRRPSGGNRRDGAQTARLREEVPKQRTLGRELEPVYDLQITVEMRAPADVDNFYRECPSGVIEQVKPRRQARFNPVLKS